MNSNLKNLFLNSQNFSFKWEKYFDVYEEGKKALDAGSIEIPFPQMVLHQASS